MTTFERIKQSAIGHAKDRYARQLTILGAPPDLIDEVTRSATDEACEGLFIKFIEGRYDFCFDWSGGSDGLLDQLRPLLSTAEKKALPRRGDFPSDSAAAIAVARKALNRSERRLVQTEALGDFSIVMLVPEDKEQAMIECVGPWIVPDDPAVIASLNAEPPDFSVQLPIAFRRWLMRTPPKTRYMAELLIEQVLPRFIDAGFKPVTTRYKVRNDRIETRAIRLERNIGDIGDHIDIRFGKYNDPRFEVACGRASLTGEWEYQHYGMLVSRGSRQYWHQWGPWLLYPSVLWPNWASRRTVRFIVRRVDQIFHFLETGERGRNIGQTILKPSQPKT